MLNGISTWFVAIFEAFYGNSSILSMIKNINDMLSDITELEAFQALAGFFVGLGSAMVVLYFLLAMIDQVTSKTFTTNELFKGLLRLIIGLALVLNVQPIISGVTAITVNLASDIENAMNVESGADFFREGKDELNQEIIEENNDAKSDFEKKNEDVIKRAEDSPNGYTLEPVSIGWYQAYKYENGNLYLYNSPIHGDSEESHEEIQANLDSRLMWTQIVAGVKPLSDYGPNFYSLQEGLSSLSLIPSLSYAVKAIIIYIIVVITNISIVLIGLMRVIELAVRTVFAPFSVADIFTERDRSAGIRYMKKIFALCLQFAVLIAINAAFSAIMQTSLFGGRSETLTNLLISSNFSEEACMQFLDTLLGGGGWLVRCAMLFAKVGVIIRSQQFCNDVIGV